MYVQNILLMFQKDFKIMFGALFNVSSGFVVGLCNFTYIFMHHTYTESFMGEAVTSPLRPVSALRNIKLTDVPLRERIKTDRT
jgi:hypothetical protein